MHNFCIDADNLMQNFVKISLSISISLLVRYVFTPPSGIIAMNYFYFCFLSLKIEHNV